MQVENRISLLDSFRAISIFSVILYHFFSRLNFPPNAVNIYPYHNQFDYFSEGKLGVQFFFIISGFVIYFTLNKTKMFLLFWKKRLIRLLPSMIIASTITFIVFNIFDAKQLFLSSHSIKNFFFSFTFLSPNLLDKIGISFTYLNGSYWSLWPEIQFYLLSSIMYYINKDKFLFNFLVLSFILIFINHIFQNILGSNKLNINLHSEIKLFYKNWILDCFNVITYLPFFLLGILFYEIYNCSKLNINYNNFLKFSLIVVFYILYGFRKNYAAVMIYTFEFTLFYLFLFYPKLLSGIQNNFFFSIGRSSYFLYLIHEHIGILLISLFSITEFPYCAFPPLLIISFLTILSVFYTKFIEVRINRFLSKYV